MMSELKNILDFYPISSGKIVLNHNLPTDGCYFKEFQVYIKLVILMCQICETPYMKTLKHIKYHETIYQKTWISHTKMYKLTLACKSTADTRENVDTNSVIPVCASTGIQL